MKTWVTFLLVVMIVAVTGCGDTVTKTKVDDVVRIKLIGPCTGAQCSQSYTLSSDDAKDKAVIKKLITWLDSSKTVGESKGEFFSMGSAPRQMRIELQNGDRFELVDAIDSECQPVKNGTECHSVDVKDQLTVTHHDKENKMLPSIRVTSPELRAWMDINWKQDIEK